MRCRYSLDGPRFRQGIHVFGGVAVHAGLAVVSKVVIGFLIDFFEADSAKGIGVLSVIDNSIQHNHSYRWGSALRGDLAVNSFWRTGTEAIFDSRVAETEVLP